MSRPMDAPKQGRILAIDLGKKRVGLAVSDPLGHFAVGLETLTCSKNTDLLTQLQPIFETYNVHTVVLGLPMNMNGSEGFKAQESREFGEVLTQETGLPVEFIDERLTSVIAHQTLQAQGISSRQSRKKGLVDETAAKLILQSYLDGQENRRL